MTLDHLKILLVEDDELFRLGLQVRLQKETKMAVLAEANDGETAIDLAKQQPFDLVLLDIGLPGLGGLETCRQLKLNHPNLPILVLTSRNERSLISRLVTAGAQGYCVKGVAAATLILAMRSVIAGASWWDATATAEIHHTFQNQSSEFTSNKLFENSSRSKIDALTRREKEILTLMSEYKTNQEIAEILYISSGTVRVHIHAILHKLEVSDRKQAIDIYFNSER
ncbi:MAG: response regulator [Pseudanabaena sp.]|jgi:two-component system NarL family response regulator|uniref:response regulator transcription factor n=1 Tax=Microcystis sp. M007S1 TaxID=2771130 RepID=UPI00258F6185|nr:response regulator transcription factor [Microcystis sp. M007S1]MCA6575830.1 response regulator transcription factor [Pseudanabaena sp. M53BS1SP1A06MG]MCA6583089.1 response regulator transcription factor [Pseudanabaena sp. M34BS1SP1A06MG]MCA6585990.1 response regulator transcription factor [Pseudanabaena sp. M051S1SP1A06QC]MCA6593904.1 response regulator transcription factor [Pseudanabaena sp. M38BS1SP1A06MG]MCA6598053.1 response regulator transcription factor [Pseudanabaena sp. M046S1SP1A0